MCAVASPVWRNVLPDVDTEPGLPHSHTSAHLSAAAVALDTPLAPRTASGHHIYARGSAAVSFAERLLLRLLIGPSLGAVASLFGFGARTMWRRSDIGRQLAEPMTSRRGKLGRQMEAK